MDIKEQIAIMQHYANGGKIEYRAKPYGTKSYPRDWKEVTCHPSGGSFQFDWEQEEARIKPEPRVIYMVTRADGTKCGIYYEYTKAEGALSAYKDSRQLDAFKPYSIKKFIEVIE